MLLIIFKFVIIIRWIIRIEFVYLLKHFVETSNDGYYDFVTLIQDRTLQNICVF